MSKQNGKELAITPFSSKAQVSSARDITSIVLNSPDQTQNAHMFDMLQDLLVTQGINITSIDFSGVPLLRTTKEWVATGPNESEPRDMTHPMDQRTISFMQSIGQNCPNLVTFKLGSTNINAQALQVIFQHVNGNTVAFLDISGNNLWGFPLLQLMHNVPNIKCIKADNTQIAVEQISTLAQIHHDLFNVQAYEVQLLSENLDKVGFSEKSTSKRAAHKQKLKELAITPYSSKAQVDNEDGVTSIVLKSPDQTQNAHMFDMLQDLLVTQGASITSIDFSGVPLLRTVQQLVRTGMQEETLIKVTHPMDERTISFMQSIGQNCHNLVTFKLGSTNVDAQALQVIFQHVNGNTVAYLDISGNNLSGFSLLQLMRNVPNVKCIKKDNSHLDPEQIASLTQFNPSLFDVVGYETKCVCIPLIFDTLENLGVPTALVGLVEEYYM